MRVTPPALGQVVAQIVDGFHRCGVGAEESHHPTPEVDLATRRLSNLRACNAQGRGDIAGVGTRDGFPEGFFEAQASRRIEKGVHFLARQPGAGARLVERATARRSDVPVPAKPHFVRAEPRVVDPDALERRGNRIEREEMPRRCKAQACGVTRLHLRVPGLGIAHDFAGEAAFGFFDRLAEVRRGPGAAHHAAKRGVAEFYSFALGVLPALDHRAFHGRLSGLE